MDGFGKICVEIIFFKRKHLQGKEELTCAHALYLTEQHV